MAKHIVAIDIGSQYISGALVSDGIIITMPSVVALSHDGKQIYDVGIQAINASNADKTVKLSYPILEGAVIDSSLAKYMLEQLLKRVVYNKSRTLSNVSVVCSVPCAMISTDKHSIEVLLLSMGVKEVAFVEAPLCSAMEAFSQYKVNKGIVADLGAECSDFALVVGDTIISGCTVYHAGKSLSQSILRMVENKYLVTLPIDKVEHLKCNVASLYPNDHANVNVTGVNMTTGTNDTINISSKEMYDIVAEHVKVFVSIVDSLVASNPDKIANAVRQDGVFLCGGSANLVGIDYYMHNECNIPVRIPKEARNATINGLVKYCKAKYI